MHIFPATLDDAAEILALQRLAYQAESALYDDPAIPPLTQTFPELRTEFGSNTILKAIVGDRLVGSVRAFQKQHDCYIGRLIVHPDHQGKGIGTALLCQIEQYFPTATRFELFTGHKSIRNLQLYKRLGYREVRSHAVNDHLTLIFLEKLNVGAVATG